jgi:TfoX/Sxy family transcriptional regulator of competence genes
VAYDEEFAARVEAALAGRADLSSRKMFGGIAFMLGGNMAVGVMGKGGLMVRVDPDDHEKALAEPGVGEMDFTGKSMKGFVVVDQGAVADDDELARWVETGADYAASLPAKKPKAGKKK